MVQSMTGALSHALNTANGGKGCSEDGTGRGVPIIAFTAQGHGADTTVDLAPPLRAGSHRHSHANAGVVPAIAFAQNSRGELRLESGHGQLAGALSTGGGKPGQGRPMIAGMAAQPDFVTPLRYTPKELSASDWSQWRVRRLMPVECERLQGMPDGYTLVPYRGKPTSDSPRYKAIGNSMAVPCVAWLGARLLRAMA
jgi:DNA (cytosine-5)-methyltransferase 1